MLSKKRKRRKTVVATVGVGVIALLFSVSLINTPNEELIGSWEDVGVNCLPSGHANLAMHNHPNLSIITNGSEEDVQGNVGILSNCMAEVHTHDSSGTLHVESVVPGKDFSLEQFFVVWGRSIERDGFNMTITIDGEEVAMNPSDIILEDDMNIVISYQSVDDN